MIVAVTFLMIAAFWLASWWVLGSRALDAEVDAARDRLDRAFDDLERQTDRWQRALDRQKSQHSKDLH